MLALSLFLIFSSCKFVSLNKAISAWEAYIYIASALYYLAAKGSDQVSDIILEHLRSRDVLKSPKSISYRHKRPTRFPRFVKVAFCSRFSKGRRRAACEGRTRGVVQILQKMEEQGKIPSEELLCSLAPFPFFFLLLVCRSLYFPFSSRIRARKQRKAREGSCSPASKRNWKPTRCLHRDMAEFAKGGTQFPQKSATADIRLREPRKYCVATNKNMYVRSPWVPRLRYKRLLSTTATTTTSSFPFLEGGEAVARDQHAKIRESSSRATILLHSRLLIQRTLQEDAAREMLSEWFIHVRDKSSPGNLRDLLTRVFPFDLFPDFRLLLLDSCVLALLRFLKNFLGFLRG